mmetsp:Transcript_19327/g.59481  ORF Transcript_19327/g.59481 Transcript_19327/m.59481 type:complete len:139 (-) Transcript_19327:99-515(-)
MTETEPLVGQTAKPASPGRVLGLVGAATFSVVLLFLALDGRSFSGTRSYGLQEKPVCSATIKNSVWNDCGSPCPDYCGRDQSRLISCVKMCYASCQCPKGRVLNRNPATVKNKAKLSCITQKKCQRVQDVPQEQVQLS